MSCGDSLLLKLHAILQDCKSRPDRPTLLANHRPHDIVAHHAKNMLLQQAGRQLLQAGRQLLKLGKGFDAEIACHTLMELVCMGQDGSAERL